MSVNHAPSGPEVRTYHLTASPAKPTGTYPDALIRDLNASVMTRTLEFEVRKDFSVIGQTKNRSSSAWKDDALVPELHKIAARHPDYAFILIENHLDASCKSVHHRWANGNYSRTPPAMRPQDYDDVTVSDIAVYLETHGWPDAARAVRRRDFAD